MNLLWIFAGLLMVLAFFLPVSEEFDDDKDYSEFKDDTWGPPEG